MHIKKQTRSHKLFALLMAFGLLFQVSLAVLADEGDIPTFASDAALIKALDPQYLCTLEEARIGISNLGHIGDWDAILIISDGSVHNDEYTFNSPSSVLTYGPYPNGTSLIVYFAVAGDSVFVDPDTYSIDDNIFDQSRHEVRYMWNQDPISNVSLSYSADALGPLTVNFSASADTHMHDGVACAGALTYEWDFGDGSATQTTTTPSVQYTYADSGKYTASVIITGENGGSATGEKTVYTDYPLAAPEEICNLEDLVFSFSNPGHGGSWSLTYQISINGNPYGIAETVTSSVDTEEITLQPRDWGSALFNTSDKGASKEVTIAVTEIDGIPVDYSVTTTVLFWLRTLDTSPHSQLFDDPYSFQLTPTIVTHCDCDPIVAYDWAELKYKSPSSNTSITAITSTERNPVIICPEPSFDLSSTRLILTTASSVTYNSGQSSYGSAGIGFTDVGSNPLLLLSNSTICRYEIPQLSVTNTDFVSTGWTFTLAHNGIEIATYGPYNTKNTIINIGFLGSDPTLGAHELTVTHLDGNPVTPQPKATITVVEPVVADFWPAVTAGSLSVDFIASVDLHHPTLGGHDCAGVGEASKTYEWFFDTGYTAVDTEYLNITHLYTSGGVKTVTLNVYDKYDEIAASVTKPITLTSGGPESTEKFSVTYVSGAGSGVTNMPGNDSDIEKDTLYTVSTVIPVRDGYNFNGWRHSADGGIYAAGSTFTMPDRNVTLVAQWSLKGTTPDPDPDPDPDPYPDPDPPKPPTPDPKPEEPKPEEPKPPVTPDPEPPVKPTPPVDVETLVPKDDGSYEQLNPDGVPIGKWTQDDDGEWIYDEYPPDEYISPIVDLPKTGYIGSPLAYIMFAGTLLALSLVVSDELKAKKENE